MEDPDTRESVSPKILRKMTMGRTFFCQICTEVNRTIAYPVAQDGNSTTACLRVLGFAAGHYRGDVNPMRSHVALFCAPQRKPHRWSELNLIAFDSFTASVLSACYAS